MKQMSLGTGYERKTKRTRKREFLDEMNLVVPWAELVALIAPHAPARGAKGGRPPFGVETMLRIHCLQHWFNLSDPAMEEALYDTPMFREFARLDMGEDHLPDESTILRFRHLLEMHNLGLQIPATVNATLTTKGLMLKQGTAIDATLIAAPSSTKNSGGERDPEMHQTKKGNQWHFGMKAHIGVDADPDWCTQSLPRRPTRMTSPKRMRCCTVASPTFTPTRATGGWTSVRKSKSESTNPGGMWP
jgi:transposase, IS5 family